MKKILHIQVLPKLSGVQRISLEIFKGLSDEEYEKWILFSNTESISKEEKEYVKQEFSKLNVKVLFSNNLFRNIGLKDLKAFIEIYKLCRKEKFDIVHTHSTKPGIIGRIAAKLACVPLVIHTVHGLAFHDFVGFPKWQFYWVCEMFASCFCDKIILVNKFYYKYFKWFKNKIRTIYNGIDYTLYPLFSQEKKKKGIQVLFIGRLDIPKDPQTLLLVAKSVLQKRKDVYFTIVGDGEKFEECKNFIEQERLSDFITLTGWRNDVADFYATHDIFITTSIYESFGIVFLEAGYYKLPVVATNVEGIPEVIVNGQTGLLSDPRDVEQISSNLETLIEDEILRDKMGQAAYERVTTLFSLRNMVKGYLEIYNS